MSTALRAMAPRRMGMILVTAVAEREACRPFGLAMSRRRGEIPQTGRFLVRIQTREQRPTHRAGREHAEPEMARNDYVSALASRR